MKNDKSIRVTQIAVRICYFLLGAAAILFPTLIDYSLHDFEVLSDIKMQALPPFYCVVPAGYTALVCLDKLLTNCRKSIVFDYKNVKLLNIISWTCFYAGAVGLAAFIIILLTGTVFETMLILAAGEFFMFLVVKVVKFILQGAVEIKEENDLTV